MNIRKVRRKCSVRGCRCTESYSLSLSNEMGNSILVCKKCILEAAEAVKNYKEDSKPIKKVHREPPTLFFNAKAMGKPDTKDGLSADVATVDETPNVATEPTTESEEQTEPKLPDTSKEPVEATPKTPAKKKKGAQGK